MQENLSKIKRVSTVLMVLCWLVIIVSPVFIGVFWIMPEKMSVIAEVEGMGLVDMATLDIWQKISCFLVTMVSQGILLYGIWRLQKLFAAYQRGEMFEVETTAHLRAFSISLLIYMLAKPLVGGVITVLLTMNNPVGQRVLEIDVSSDDLFQVLLGAVMLVVAWTLNEGAKAVRENREIV
ncbi:DUF2975 domain-containing protein [Aestuariispira insulae]|uniref:DUF2975 family protein n=1 Tax=Aestuariispira insulae TaxID=1461337 RepID=A0A3D9HX79_9PROT|nr:DUF2975 domain-containing protein [Aestuariispira insulae]RED53506.1 hypothetical protein DFP90_101296 [Aestuariispira insulae]